MDENKGKTGKGCITVVIILAVLGVIGSLVDDKKEQSFSLPKEYEWVVGIWTCNTPYGPLTYRLGGDGSFSDNEGEEGTYVFESGKIYTHLNATMGFAIEIDDVNRRIGAGEGYWMIKVSN